MRFHCDTRMGALCQLRESVRDVERVHDGSDDPQVREQLDVAVRHMRWAQALMEALTDAATPVDRGDQDAEAEGVEGVGRSYQSPRCATSHASISAAPRDSGRLSTSGGSS